jgi:hypothetical protein
MTNVGTLRPCSPRPNQLTFHTNPVIQGYVTYTVDGTSLQEVRIPDTVASNQLCGALVISKSAGEQYATHSTLLYGRL